MFVSRAEGVDRVRDQFLSGAGLAHDQHGARCGRDLADHPEYFLYFRAFPDNAAERREHLPLRDGAGFDQILSSLPRLFCHCSHFVRSERLGEIVKRAELHGFDGGGDGGIAGDHHGDDIRETRAQSFQQLHPAHIRHFQIGEENVERLLFEQGQGLFAGVGDLYAVSFAGQNLFAGSANRGFVVDNKRFRCIHTIRQSLQYPLRELPLSLFRGRESFPLLAIPCDAPLFHKRWRVPILFRSFLW